MLVEETKEAVKGQNNSLFSQLENYEHEQVVFGYDKDTGLKSIIAIHNTVLGPALGGTRMWNYASEADAIKDVLRLSRGMTYKSAISGINLGGGKAVIIGDSYKDKSEALWRSYGKLVNSLGGKYVTAEDVGTSAQDMEYIAEETKWVMGKPSYLGGSGDPSPMTAYGTYLGMKASVKKLTGSDSLQGKRVAVQGIGHVGMYLLSHLSKEGAKIMVCDIYEDKLKEISKDYKVEIIKPDDIYDVDADIYAPCAMGGTINDDTIDRLKCSIIAGAANNQLDDEKKHGELLKQKGVYYAPDFLINAGGVINVYLELVGYSQDRAYAITDKIFNRTLEIYDKADAESMTTQAAAMKIAQERIDSIAKLKAKI